MLQLQCELCSSGRWLSQTLYDTIKLNVKYSTYRHEVVVVRWDRRTYTSHLVSTKNIKTSSQDVCKKATEVDPSRFFSCCSFTPSKTIYSRDPFVRKARERNLINKYDLIAKGLNLQLWFVLCNLSLFKESLKVFLKSAYCNLFFKLCCI